jgi:hypothetical protein
MCTFRAHPFSQDDTHCLMCTKEKTFCPQCNDWLCRNRCCIAWEGCQHMPSIPAPVQDSPPQESGA